MDASRWIWTLALTVAITACVADSVDRGEPCTATCDDRGDTPRVLRNNLLANLLAIMDGDLVMFGQQAFNVSGVRDDGTQWVATVGDDMDRSDVRSVTGQHPAVLGLDVWDIAFKPEDWTPQPGVYARAAEHVLARGGVVSMSWHMQGCNADGDGFGPHGNEACLCLIANDDERAREWYRGELDRVAAAFRRHGLDRLPIVLRPFHEHNGGWFWWGAPYWSCQDVIAEPRVTGQAAYRLVFQMLVDRLRNELGLDNLLIAYSPGSTLDESDYLAGYPGDAYVDVLGIDYYYAADGDFARLTDELRRQLEMITGVARARRKVAALTEIGNLRLGEETTPADSRWFSDHLLPLIHGNPNVRLAWALAWENRTSTELFVPYVNHPGVEDFRAFCASDATLFLDDVDGLYAPPPDVFPVCAACESDPDGDGWGWENQASCVMASWCLPGD
jgi:mannan endo-1,4-beta-mannosidase